MEIKFGSRFIFLNTLYSFELKIVNFEKKSQKNLYFLKKATLI